MQGAPFSAAFATEISCLLDKIFLTKEYEIISGLLGLYRSHDKEQQKAHEFSSYSSLASERNDVVDFLGWLVATLL